MSSRLKPEVHFYLVSDSYSKAQTRESVESAKKGLEYESFEYESRLDTPLLVCITNWESEKKEKKRNQKSAGWVYYVYFYYGTVFPLAAKGGQKKINIHL